MRARFWIWFCAAVIFIPEGSAMQCYKCHQVSKQCNNGVVDKLYRANCSDQERCAVFKYEAWVSSGIKVQATMRDCALYTNEIRRQFIAKEAEQHATEVMFHECDKPLCNSDKKCHAGILALVLLIFIFTAA